MTFARIRVVVAAAAFLGWLGWLGFAVTQRGSVPLVSVGQLTGATHVVVAEVAADGTLPASTATVKHVLRGAGLIAGDTIPVPNLPAAQPPIGGFPGHGEYLLALTSDGRTFRVAGLPASPGYEPSTAARPVIYPWTDDIRRQTATIGLAP
ncbi:MAG: hypothetical protein ACRC7O_05655 [Fimbriiglobus sp.]